MKQVSRRRFLKISAATFGATAVAPQWDSQSPQATAAPGTGRGS